MSFPAKLNQLWQLEEVYTFLNKNVENCQTGVFWNLRVSRNLKVKLTETMEKVT